MTRSKVNIRLLIIALLIIIASLSIYYNHSHTHKASSEKTIYVHTENAKTSDVPVYLTSFGSVIPQTTVNIQSQVSGQIIQVTAKDGQKVKQGEVIAKIDKRPYEAQIVQYEGQYERDKAFLENAKLDLKRYQELWKQNSVSKQIVDTQTSLVNQYEGTVKLDKGMLDNAKVNLSYCTITSPIDGQVGIIQIDEGNIVNASTNIAVVNSLTPMEVLFSIPEAQLSSLLDAFNQDNNLTTLAYDQEQNKLLAKGTLEAIDNQIDQTTGTVKLKAIFAEDGNKLFPNQFVNIKLLLTTLKSAITLPVSAIQYGKKGSIVYKVNTDDNTVHVTQVEVGATENNQIVIKSGINEGDTVVTEGVDKLTDGAKIATGT